MAVTGIATRWSQAGPRLRSVLRIVAGFMFVFPGTMILFAFPSGMPSGHGAPPVMSQLWIGGVLELVGGSLALIGLFTRPVAFVLAGEMAVAYFQFHQPKGLLPIQNDGMGAALYCFVWLYLSAAGGGPWSLDARLRGPRAPAGIAS